MKKNIAVKTLAQRKAERTERRMKRLQGLKTKKPTDPFTKLNPEE